MLAYCSMENYMKLAVSEAKEAALAGEVPVGAVIIKNDKILATGRNRIIEKKDPTCHAEIEAIRAAANKIGYERLTGAVMYVTLEPCAMCTGAMLLARIEKVVYGAKDPKGGCCGSVYNLAKEKAFNHEITVEFCEDKESSSLLKEFFKKLRTSKNQLNSSKNI